MTKGEKALLASRIRTINVMVVNVKQDVEDGCLPCLEHHQKMITDTLFDIYMDLEDKLEQANN